MVQELQPFEQRIVDCFKRKEAQLDLSGFGLTKIPECVKKLPWLEKIDLSHNKIQNIDELGSLTNLSVVLLNNNEIESLDGLKKLENLRSLDVGHNKIQDISLLANLRELLFLCLTCNEITSLDALENLTNLRQFDASYNRIENIAVLGHLLRLTKLLLNNNKIENLTALEKLSSLQCLNLSSNLIEDIKELGFLSELSELLLHNNQIAYISPINSLVKLQVLDLRSNKVPDRDSFQEFSAKSCQILLCDDDQNYTLESVTRKLFSEAEIAWFGGCISLKEQDKKIRQFLGFAVDGELKSFEKKILDCFKRGSIRLDLSHCELTSVPEAVRALPWVEQLVLSHNKITDLRPLKWLRKLDYLELSHNQISNLEITKQAPLLLYLNVKNNNIVDVSPLKHQPNLETLILRGNNIEDIRPLRQLESLEQIDLRENPLSEIQALSDLKKLSEVKLPRGLPKFEQAVSFDTTLSALRTPMSEKQSRVFLGFSEEGDLQPFEEKILDCFINKRPALDLSMCELQSIPESVTQLYWLKSIFLRHNLIEDISILTKLRNLTNIDVSHNPISDLTQFRNVKNLKVLNISSTKIESISEIKYLNLFDLDLSRNNIEFRSFGTNLRILHSLRGLGILKLSTNQIADRDVLDFLLPYFPSSEADKWKNLRSRLHPATRPYYGHWLPHPKGVTKPFRFPEKVTVVGKATQEEIDAIYLKKPFYTKKTSNKNYLTALIGVSLLALSYLANPKKLFSVFSNSPHSGEDSKNSFKSIESTLIPEKKKSSSAVKTLEKEPIPIFLPRGITNANTQSRILWPVVLPSKPPSETSIVKTSPQISDLLRQQISKICQSCSLYFTAQKLPDGSQYLLAIPAQENNPVSLISNTTPQQTPIPNSSRSFISSYQQSEENRGYFQLSNSLFEKISIICKGCLLYLIPQQLSDNKLYLPAPTTENNKTSVSLNGRVQTNGNKSLWDISRYQTTNFLPFLTLLQVGGLIKIAQDPAKSLQITNSSFTSVLPNPSINPVSIKNTVPASSEPHIDITTETVKTFAQNAFKNASSENSSTLLKITATVVLLVGATSAAIAIYNHFHPKKAQSTIISKQPVFINPSKLDALKPTQTSALKTYFMYFSQKVKVFFSSFIAQLLSVFNKKLIPPANKLNV